MVLPQLDELQAGGQLGQGAVEKGQIHLPVQQQLQQPVGPLLNDVHRDVGVTAAEGGEHAAEVDALEAGDDAQVEGALAQPGIEGHLSLKGLGTLKDLPGPENKILARLRQGGTPRIAGEEGHPQLLLQLGDLLGQGGLSHVAGLGRQGKIPRIGHGKHIAKRVKFHMVSCLRSMGWPPVPAAGGAGGKSVFSDQQNREHLFCAKCQIKRKSGGSFQSGEGLPKLSIRYFPGFVKKVWGCDIIFNDTSCHKQELDFFRRRR